MKIAHARKKKRPHIRIKIVFIYTLYKDTYLDEDAPPVFTTEDPFLAYWKASDLARSAGGCVLVTHIIKSVNNRRAYDIEQARWIGGFMKIRHEGEYDTTILYADNPNEFFTKKLLLKYPEFNLWQVVHNKYIGHILDFTREYDSVRILAIFGNRIHMRLDHGPELITDKRKDILARSAHFAIIPKREKNNFF